MDFGRHFDSCFHKIAPSSNTLPHPPRQMPIPRGARHLADVPLSMCWFLFSVCGGCGGPGRGWPRAQHRTKSGVRTGACVHVRTSFPVAVPVNEVRSNGHPMSLLQPVACPHLDIGGQPLSCGMDPRTHVHPQPPARSNQEFPSSFCHKDAARSWKGLRRECAHGCFRLGFRSAF